MRALPILVACLGLAGCVLSRSGTRPEDAGAPMGLDAGTGDAGPRDAALADAGPPDAGCLAPRVECPGEGCVDPTADPLHCGGCAERCSAPDHGDATCAGGTCGFTCRPGFEPDGPGCVPSRCGNGLLDPGEACDDANLVAGDGCNESCAIESEAGDRCPGAEIGLGGPRQSYLGTTRFRTSGTQCPSRAFGPDAVYTVRPSWSGMLRIRVRPIGDWDVTLEVYEACPPEDDERLECVDRYYAGADEEVVVEVMDGGALTVIVSGYRADDAGDFAIWFERA